MVDYQEVVKKSGQKIVFLNMEDFLLDYYHLNSPEEIEPHKSTSGDDYIVHCPFCAADGHTKHKLYIKGDLSVGHCFVCTRAFINVTDEIKFNVDAENPIRNFYREPFHVVPLTDPEWTLDKFEYECDDFDETGYNYLLGRHKYMKDLWQALDFKFLDGNVVMPFKYRGEVFYYQIRFTCGGSKIRYFFPPIDKGKKPPYIIEHGENKKFIICEGVYDAISLLIQAPSYTPMAVLGSHITDYQLEFLREYTPTEILVMMDELEISKRIAQKIKSVIDYCPVHIVRTSGDDPEEIMKAKMKKKPGSEIGWIDKAFEKRKNISFQIPNFFNNVQSRNR